jgi:tRNA-Thr(GGU) m(6)t(6)A37 methyltransferase TsaA
MQMKNNKITYEPIGVIRTQYNSSDGVPIQPSGAENVTGFVELENKYMSGLKDLDGFSHIILIYHFHLNEGYSLRVVPFLDKDERGIFATRAPIRPNSIGLSVVKLNKIEANKIFVENIDVVDGTPLLDIKPYVRDFDKVMNSKFGWLENSAHLSKTTKADKRFTKDAKENENE